MAHRYLLFYKPYNVLSQFTDERTDALSSSGDSLQNTRRQTLKDFIDVPGVYAVGRLDRDSEGLLLLTDDGPMQHWLSHPKFGHWRRYWVQVENAATSPPMEEALGRLRKGVTIRGYQTRPAKAQMISPPDLPPRDPPIRYRKRVPTAWFELMLSEGKNRQVRRMTAAVGYPTLRLVRSGLWLSENIGLDRISPESEALTLCGLQPGEWRYLTAEEVRSLPQRPLTRKSNAKKTGRGPARKGKSRRSKKRASAQKPRSQK